MREVVEFMETMQAGGSDGTNLLKHSPLPPAPPPPPPGARPPPPRLAVAHMVRRAEAAELDDARALRDGSRVLQAGQRPAGLRRRCGRLYR